MAKTFKAGTITAEQIYTLERKVRRDAEIQQGRINYKKTFKTEKDFNRKKSKQINWD